MHRRGELLLVRAKSLSIHWHLCLGLLEYERAIQKHYDYVAAHISGGRCLLMAAHHHYAIKWGYESSGAVFTAPFARWDCLGRQHLSNAVL